MDYFNILGKVSYEDYSVNYPNYILSTNIAARLKVKKSLLQNLTTYEYYVSDGQRPEEIAYYYYGDAKLSWLIFLANDIIDPYYDWPLNSSDFEKYISFKYGSFNNSKNEIHHYEEILIPQQVVNNVLKKEIAIEIDEQRYRSLKDNQRRSVTFYDYESSLNEAKRNIILVEDIYLPKILENVTKIAG